MLSIIHLKYNILFKLKNVECIKIRFKITIRIVSKTYISLIFIIFRNSYRIRIEMDVILIGIFKFQYPKLKNVETLNH